LTIVQMLFKGFPPLKGLGYIISQIVGAYIAFGFVYLQWHPTILAVEGALIEKGVFETAMFETTGVAGIFALYAPAGAPLGAVFLNEFMVSFVSCHILHRGDGRDAHDVSIFFRSSLSLSLPAWTRPTSSFRRLLFRGLWA
jgi:glycerol uptake facilitator-like aquaporin